MSDWYAPNQQAVRGDESGPAEEGTGGAAGDAVSPAASFDPSAHTIDEVQAYVLDHPDERSAVLDAEQAGKARVTLIDWLYDDES